MSKLICGSKKSALSALEAIAGNMSPGTPKEALEAVAAWVKKTIPDDVPREERERLMLSIFEKE
ncbi:MAG: hypothetical protein LBH43_10215, partial [Treponema sp.]|nr:hypothetical protein [Treponema sp.]